MIDTAVVYEYVGELNWFNWVFFHDTATGFYLFFCILCRNEADVGKAIKKSGLDRNEIFVVTKCGTDQHGYDNLKQGFKKSLERYTSPVFFSNTSAVKSFLP